jgi:hypothetical protein
MSTEPEAKVEASTSLPRLKSVNPAGGAIAVHEAGDPTHTIAPL